MLNNYSDYYYMSNNYIWFLDQLYVEQGNDFDVRFSISFLDHFLLVQKFFECWIV